MNLNKKNNIKLKIINSLSPSSNLLIVENGNLLWNDFLETEQDKRFLLTLIKFSWTSPIQIEIIRVLSKTWNNLKIERAVEETPLNYNATESSRLAYEFNSWDYAFMNLTTWEINRIYEEIGNIKQLIENNYYKKWQVDEFIRWVNTFAWKIKINPWEDLNNIKNPGFYYNPTNVESDQILNHPKRQFGENLQWLDWTAFWMIVYEASWVIQELTTFSKEYKFIRRFYDNGWSPWRVLYVDWRWSLWDDNKHSIAIWDNDIGFKQVTDWKIEIFANHERVGWFDREWFEFNSCPTTTKQQSHLGHSLARKDYVDNKIKPELVYDSWDIGMDSGGDYIDFEHNLNISAEDFYIWRYKLFYNDWWHYNNYWIITSYRNESNLNAWQTNSYKARINNWSSFSHKRLKIYKFW